MVASIASAQARPAPHLPRTTGPQNNEVQSPQEKTKSAPGRDLHEKPRTSSEIDGAEPDRARGVLRLLQEGHFKGVADVRLRLNFAEELGTLKQAETDGLFQTRLDLLEKDLTALQEEAPLAAEEGEATEEDSALDQALISFTNLKNLLADGEEPQTALANFQLEVAKIFPETSNETGTTSEGTPVVSADAVLGNLLNQAITELGTILNETSIVPEVSAPTGNGSAYDKFLSIYQSNQDVDAETPSLLREEA